MQQPYVQRTYTYIHIHTHTYIKNNNIKTHIHTYIPHDAIWLSVNQLINVLISLLIKIQLF